MFKETTADSSLCVKIESFNQLDGCMSINEPGVFDLPKANCTQQKNILYFLPGETNCWPLPNLTKDISRDRQLLFELKDRNSQPANFSIELVNKSIVDDPEPETKPEPEPAYNK